MASARCGGWCGSCGPKDTSDGNIPVVKYSSVGRRSTSDSETTVEIDFQLGEIQPTKITRYGGIVVSNSLELMNSHSISILMSTFLLLLISL